MSNIKLKLEKDLAQEKRRCHISVSNFVVTSYLLSLLSFVDLQYDYALQKHGVEFQSEYALQKHGFDPDYLELESGRSEAPRAVARSRVGSLMRP